jgi:hypothetical protein
VHDRDMDHDKIARPYLPGSGDGNWWSFGALVVR